MKWEGRGINLTLPGTTAVALLDCSTEMHTQHGWDVGAAAVKVLCVGEGFA